MSSFQVAQPASTAPVLQSSGFGSSFDGSGIGAAGSASGSGNDQQQQGDNISLSEGSLVGGGLVLGLGAIAAGAAGALIIKGKTPAPATNTPPAPEQQQPLESHDEPPATRTENTSIRTMDRINGCGIPEHLTHYAHGTPPPDGTKNPLKVTQRFHPQQSGANCSLDTLNMLVNGYGPLRTTPTDYIAMKDGYQPDGSQIFPKGLAMFNKTPQALAIHSMKKPGTVTDPRDFPKIYAKNFEVAKYYLEQEIKANHEVSKNTDLLKQVKEIQQTDGALDHKEYSMLAKDQSSLRHKLGSSFKGNIIAVAVPTTPNSLGTPQAIHKFEHHYFTIERMGDHWVKRDSLNSRIEKIRRSDKKQAQTAFEAIEAIYQGDLNKPKEKPRTLDTTRPMHVYIPGPR